MSQSVKQVVLGGLLLCGNCRRRGRSQAACRSVHQTKTMASYMISERGRIRCPWLEEKEMICGSHHTVMAIAVHKHHSKTSYYFESIHSMVGLLQRIEKKKACMFAEQLSLICLGLSMVEAMNGMLSSSCNPSTKQGFCQEIWEIHWKHSHKHRIKHNFQDKLHMKAIVWSLELHSAATINLHVEESYEASISANKQYVSKHF